MCLAKAYVGKNTEELLAEDITSMKTVDGKLVITTLFGEQQEIEATIAEIDFKASRVLLEKS
ncbi:MAG: CooT family nickel-binding protein [Dehalococcoidia bacterium]|jgi:predicted RNA-binding protein